MACRLSPARVARSRRPVICQSPAPPAQRARDGEAMGEEFQELVNQLLRLCRKPEQENYTARQDLGYQPSN